MRSTPPSKWVATCAAVEIGTEGHVAGERPWARSSSRTSSSATGASTRSVDGEDVAVDRHVDRLGLDAGQLAAHLDRVHPGGPRRFGMRRGTRSASTRSRK